MYRFAYFVAGCIVGYITSGYVEGFFEAEEREEIPSCKETDDFALADALAGLSGLRVPRAVEEIRNAPIVHDHVCGIPEMADMVCGFLGM